MAYAEILLWIMKNRLNTFYKKIYFIKERLRTWKTSPDIHVPLKLLAPSLFDRKSVIETGRPRTVSSSAGVRTTTETTIRPGMRHCEKVYKSFVLANLLTNKGSILQWFHGLTYCALRVTQPFIISLPVVDKEHMVLLTSYTRVSNSCNV